MKPFTTLAIIIFTLMALVHLYRLVWGLDIVVQGHAMPQWPSIVGLIVAGLLAIMVWRESRQG
jgi:hypothetical protein